MGRDAHCAGQGHRQAAGDSRRTVTRESNLLDNAIDSIRIGVEDFKADDAARALSAIRNLHAGLLLLAKEVLARKVPNVDEEAVIAAGYTPLPDGHGGVRYVARSQNTIDLKTIGRRFRDFGIKVDQATLRKLNQLRNDVEHRYTRQAPDAVRQTIVDAFPVAAHMFRLVDVEPLVALGGAWRTMLQEHQVYDQERKACRGTFDSVEWLAPVVGRGRRECPECRSELLEQVDAKNREQENADAVCRSCGARVSAESLIESAVDDYYWGANYRDAKHGGEGVVLECPECGFNTYVVDLEPAGCVICGYTIEGQCGRCGEDLTPSNLGANSPDFCDYCDHMIFKDD